MGVGTKIKKKLWGWGVGTEPPKFISFCCREVWGERIKKKS